MNLYQHLLTGTRIDPRKVRRFAISRARFERDLSIMVAAGLRQPNIPLSHVAAWRRTAARKLMIAGWGCADNATIFADRLRSAQEDAEAAARNIAYFAKPAAFQIAAE